MIPFRAPVVPVVAPYKGIARRRRCLRHSTSPAPRIVFPAELLESSRHGIRIGTRSEILSRRIVPHPYAWRVPPDSRSDFSGANAPLRHLEGLHPAPRFDGIGFDENLYRRYVDSLIAGGLTAYPEIVDHYIEVQQKLTGSILPPVRFLYIFSAYLWHQVFGTEALVALHDVASLFSILTLLLSRFSPGV